MKRTGRPPLAADDESVPVHLKLPSAQYDAFYQRASADGVSVPEVIRRDLRRTPAHIRKELRNPK